MARPGAPRRAVVALAAVALAGAMAAGLAPAAAAAPPACRVKNPTQDTWFATSTGQALTRAINDANEGDRLNVFGRCRGSFSIGKDLRIFGTINRQDPTVLDGAGGEGVLFVNERVTVTLTRLVITGGNATLRVGGGIQNGGLLTLNRTTVTGDRSASDGGGILSVNTLTLNQTVVSGNVPDNCPC